MYLCIYIYRSARTRRRNDGWQWETKYEPTETEKLEGVVLGKGQMGSALTGSQQIPCFCQRDPLVSTPFVRNQLALPKAAKRSPQIICLDK